MHHLRRRPLALFLALGLAAAACGSSGDSASEEAEGDGEGAERVDCPVDALDEAAGPVNVVVWHSYVAETKDTLEELAGAYNASQDQVTVEIQSQGVSYEELLRKYEQAIPTDDLPAIAILEDTVTQFIADSGTVLPAQSCFDADGIDLGEFLEVGVDYYSVDGALQAGTLNLSSVLLYYNREHFRRAGLDPDDPPRTIAEVREAAQALKDAGVTEKPLVMNMQPWFIEFWLTGAGAPIVDNDNGRDGLATESRFDNESTLEIFTWLEGMNDDGLLNPVPGREGQFDHYFAMALEQASMTFETSTAVTSVDAFLEGELDPSAFDLDLDEIPAIELDIGAAEFPGPRGPGRGQVGGGVWYMTGDPTPDEVQAAAWDFVKFMNSVDSQVEWHLGGSYLPWVKAAADDPDLQEAWETTRRGRWLAIGFGQLLNIDPAFPGPLIGPYTQVREAIRDAIDDMILAGGAPAEVIAEADGKITEAVQAYEFENF